MPLHNSTTTNAPATAQRTGRAAIDMARTASLFAATLTLGLIAGFFYSYEVSVMRGFARLADTEFISAMQAVNATIRNLAFAPSFFGAAVLAILAACLHAGDWRSARAMLAAGAAIIYLAGGFVLTIRINVPMNDWLASMGPSALMPDPRAIRLLYEADWVFWNLVRTILSTLSFSMMLAALWLDARQNRPDDPVHA